MRKRGFHANDKINIERIKETVLPAIFRDPVAIGQYGENRSEEENLQELSEFMDSGAVSTLAIKIGEIVTKLTDADPQRMTQKTTWYDRLVGRDVERQVRYQVARKALDELLGEAEGIAQGVRDTLRALDDMLANHAIETEHLRMYIQAGREFLDENPQVGMVEAGSLEFDRPRERFARKLANLAALLSSHEMSVAQMNLTRAGICSIVMPVGHSCLGQITAQGTARIWRLYCMRSCGKYRNVTTTDRVQTKLSSQSAQSCIISRRASTYLA